MADEKDGQQDKNTNDAAGGGQQPGQGKVFTQEEVNALIGSTRKEEREKYGDYKDLKAKAAELDDLKKAQLSETEKAKQDKEAADNRAAQAIKTANERLLKAAFIAEAAKHGAKIPADAYALAIADGAQVSVGEDGNATGVEEAVKALVEAGRLPLTGRVAAPGLDGGAGGQSRPERTVVLSDEQKRLAQYAGMTEEQYIKYLTQAPVDLSPDIDKK